MLKFVFGPITGLVSGLNMWESIFLTIAGMMSSVFIFSFVGEKLRGILLKRGYKKRKGAWALKIEKYLEVHGLKGIAFLTPVILSPIVGTLMATSVSSDRRKLFFHMLISATFWSLILHLILFKINDHIF